MKLEGIHHISCITADAPANVNFYAGTLGLRMVKKTVNQDDPTVYHLFYADELGSPGADLTFFEYPGAARGRAGTGMVHLIALRVGSDAALEFWADRLEQAGVVAERSGQSLAFADPEGLAFELRVSEVSDTPLVAEHPDIPAAMAIQGFDGVRAYSGNPEASRRLLETGLGFATSDGVSYTARGDQRSGTYVYDPPPGSGTPGAGTVHHVAFASRMDDHLAWRQRVLDGGGQPTPVIDRFYFRSIYFREPSGVLFELATMGPGFATDEDPEHLGERLSLPPAFEHFRSQVEQNLTPLPNPRRPS